MKSFYYLLLGILILFSLNGVVYSDDKEKQGNITGGIGYTIPDWFKESFLDIAADVEEAGENDKHVILFFHLDQCPYCDKMLKESFSSPLLKAEIEENFDVIAINIKGSNEIEFTKDQSFTEKELARQLNIQYTPAILFLNNKNKAVARLNGYRSAKKFRHILNYVKEKEYKKGTLMRYLNQKEKGSVYALKEYPLFSKKSDFSKEKKPLAIVFEDANCDECDYFHSKIINREDVKKELKAFTLVRLDARSTETIIGLDGKKTTPKEWAETLKLTYRPGVVLFDNKKEITRIDGFLYSFHFKEVFRYVSGKYYKEFETYNEYLSERQQELIKKGINIDISK
jgi:thioredoxin-related protein